MPFLAKDHVDIPTKDILSWIFDDLSYDQDDPIYIDALNPENTVSARQARSMIRKLVAGFRSIGVQEGDCVCINSFNDIHYPLFFLGVVAAGGVFTGVNPAYTPYELAHTLKIAKVKFILTQPDLLDPVIKGSTEAGLSKDKILIFNPNGEKAPSGYKQWNDLLRSGEQDWVRFNDHKTSSNTPAARMFSSGTTGLPKAADLSHYNLVAEHTLVYETSPRPWRSKRLLCLPMFHAATAPMAFTSCLKDSGQGYITPRFDPESWFWAHEKYEITDLGVVPPIAVMAINHPLNKKYSLKSVKVANAGAAPLDKGPQARMQALIADDAPFTQVWGKSIKDLSEMASLRSAVVVAETLKLL